MRGKEAEETETEGGKETDQLLLDGRTTQAARGEGGAAVAEENGTEKSAANGGTRPTTEEEEEQGGTGPKRKGSKKEGDQPEGGGALLPRQVPINTKMIKLTLSSAGYWPPGFPYGPLQEALRLFTLGPFANH